MKIPMAHPLATLQKGLNHSAAYATFVRKALEPCNYKAKIILYTDEITPGQVLQGDQNRKTTCIYWTFSEFGYPALSHEVAWITLATVRHKDVLELEGGQNTLVKGALREFFGTSPTSPDAAFDCRRGVVIQLGESGPPKVLFADSDMILQDLLAHQEVLRIRGPNAIKLCMKCMNVVKHNSTCLPDASGSLISSTDLRVHLYKQHTTATVRAAVRRVAQVAVENPPALEELQINTGFNYVPNNFIVDEHLGIRVGEVVVYDWMHLYFVDGIYVRELKALLGLLNTHGLGGNSLDMHLKLWTWPMCITSARSVCSLRKGYHEPTGNASEYLSTAAPLNKWLRDVVMPNGVCVAACRSMEALIQVVVCLMEAQYSRVLPAELERRILRHLTLHLEAYGETIWTMKFHGALHLPGTLKDHGKLPSCFCLERKHRIPKRHMQGRTNTVNFARGVLEDVTVQWLGDLVDPTRRSSLVQERPASRRMREALLQLGCAEAEDTVVSALVAVVDCNNIGKGDVALYKTAGGFGVARVWFHCRIGSTSLSCVQEWEVLNRPHPSYLRARKGVQAPRMIPTGNLEIATIYSDVADGAVATVLLPLHYL